MSRIGPLGILGYLTGVAGFAAALAVEAELWTPHPIASFIAIAAFAVGMVLVLLDYALLQGGE